MLRNISTEPLTLKWNGKEIILHPQDALDVQETFNLTEKEILAVEDRFVSKLKGKIEKGSKEIKKPQEQEEPKEVLKQEEPLREIRKRGRPKKWR